MDLQLIALFGLIAAVAFFWVRMNSRWLARPGFRIQRIFSATAGGLLLFVAGLVGCDLRYSHGWFRGVKWVEGPVWWEVGGGLALLLLAIFWARRLTLRSSPN